ncbi:hypothetical protein F5B21DRAFT_452565 [Xylaria acuta]|nr:hypothetical protein F5B21DRAFT_452565 [Xylaria acuta]
MGHDLPNDMAALRFEPERVVDSRVLTAQAVYGKSVAKFPSSWGLQEMCSDLMGIDIQPRAKRDTLEEALATRELILWCLTHPDELKKWGVHVEAEIKSNKWREEAMVEAGCARPKADNALRIEARENVEEVERLKEEVDDLKEKLEILQKKIDLKEMNKLEEPMARMKAQGEAVEETGLLDWIRDG